MVLLARRGRGRPSRRAARRQAPVYRRGRSPSRSRRSKGRSTSPAPPARRPPSSLASPNLCNKAWIWRQYDRSVRTNTVVGPPGDAAVTRVKGTKKGLALTADVNPRYCFADPTRGAAHAVAEAAR